MAPRVDVAPAASTRTSALTLVFLRMLACEKARVAARMPVHPGRVTLGDTAQASGMPSA